MKYELDVQIKRYARKRGARYQTMIRKLVDSYAQHTLSGKVKGRV